MFFEIFRFSMGNDNCFMSLRRTNEQSAKGGSEEFPTLGMFMANEVRTLQSCLKFISTQNTGLLRYFVMTVPD